MTELETIEAYVKRLEAQLVQYKLDAEGYVKAHVVYLIGAGCLILGAVVGHYV
jgi:hypothetical protein